VTQPVLPSVKRHLAVDLHKHYLVIGGVNARQEVVLSPRRIALDEWPTWAKGDPFCAKHRTWWGALQVSPTERLHVPHDLATLDQVAEQLKEIDDELRRLSCSEPWADVTSYLLHLPGVGLISRRGCASRHTMTSPAARSWEAKPARPPTALRAFRLAAQAVSRTETALGAFFRRMRAKHGAAKAKVATACKIARIVYHMLKDRREYVDHGADYCEHKDQEQALKKLKRQAAKSGMQLVPVTTWEHEWFLSRPHSKAHPDDHDPLGDTGDSAATLLQVARVGI
jgi:hypothetical protein